MRTRSIDAAAGGNSVPREETPFAGSVIVGSLVVAAVSVTGGCFLTMYLATAERAT